MDRHLLTSAASSDLDLKESQVRQNLFDVRL